MDLDRHSIERSDFPIRRRGYDPAVVDAHLRELAAAVHDLHQAFDARQEESLGSAAGSQVQGILEVAETTAAGIERQAAERAAATRQAADSDAQRTRGEAVARSQAHVQAVSQATAALLEKVEAMDREVGALVQSLRAGAGRLAADLRGVEENMGELYDAAGGGAAASAQEGQAASESDTTSEPATAFSSSASAPEIAPETVPLASTNGASEHAPAEPPATAQKPSQAPAQASSEGGEDRDGARLIALNMALNGEPREQTDRYLADNFELPDREKLLDEVYAAIEA